MSNTNDTTFEKNRTGLIVCSKLFNWVYLLSKYKKV